MKLYLPNQLNKYLPVLLLFMLSVAGSASAKTLLGFSDPEVNAPVFSIKSASQSLDIVPVNQHWICHWVIS